jgi:hypothetical protein
MHSGPLCTTHSRAGRQGKPEVHGAWCVRNCNVQCLVQEFCVFCQYVWNCGRLTCRLQIGKNLRSFTALNSHLWLCSPGKLCSSLCSLDLAVAPLLKQLAKPTNKYHPPNRNRLAWLTWNEGSRDKWKRPQWLLEFSSPMRSYPPHPDWLHRLTCKSLPSISLRGIQKWFPVSFMLSSLPKVT